MVLSVSLLNAVLNACLWFAHAMIALVAQRVYVAAARLQLAKSGETHGTDSNETHFLHWVQKKVHDAMRPSSGNQRTAGWAIVIMLVMFALLPAELVLESGLDVRRDCYVALNRSTTGVCARPFAGTSLIRASAMALLVSNFQWLDGEWQFVREGSSVMLWTKEVRRTERSVVMHDATKHINYLARNCHVQTLACVGCGSFEIRYRRELASFAVTRSSYLQKGTPGEYCLGDLVGEKSVKTGFMFCRDASQSPNVSNGPNTKRFASVGIESVIDGLDDEKRRAASSDADAVQLVKLHDEKTRVYKVACDTDGLADQDLTTALVMMRSALIETYPLSAPLNGSLGSLPLLRASDALKAVFALKASDMLSNCTADDVEVYQECGSFEWRQASYVCFLYSAMLIAWLIMSLISAKYRDIAVPHDSVTWRKYAYEGLILFHDQGDDEYESTGSGAGGSEGERDEDGLKSPQLRSPTPVLPPPSLKSPDAMAGMAAAASSPTACSCRGQGCASSPASPPGAAASAPPCTARREEHAAFGTTVKKLTFSPNHMEIPIEDDDDDEIVPATERIPRSTGRVSVISADKNGFVARRLSTLNLSANKSSLSGPRSLRSPPHSVPAGAARRARADRRARRESSAAEATDEELEEERSVTTQKNIFMHADAAESPSAMVFTPSSEMDDASPGFRTNATGVCAASPHALSPPTPSWPGPRMGSLSAASAASAHAAAARHGAAMRTELLRERGLERGSPAAQQSVSPQGAGSGTDMSAGGSNGTDDRTMSPRNGRDGAKRRSKSNRVGRKMTASGAATPGAGSEPVRARSTRSPFLVASGVPFRKVDSAEQEVRSSGSQNNMRCQRQRTVRLDCRNGEVSSKVLLVRPWGGDEDDG